MPCWSLSCGRLTIPARSGNHGHGGPSTEWWGRRRAWIRSSASEAERYTDGGGPHSPGGLSADHDGIEAGLATGRCMRRATSASRSAAPRHSDVQQVRRSHTSRQPRLCPCTSASVSPPPPTHRRRRRRRRRSSRARALTIAGGRRVPRPPPPHRGVRRATSGAEGHGEGCTRGRA
jgi:hypothetical protein